MEKDEVFRELLNTITNKNRWLVIGDFNKCIYKWEKSGGGTWNSKRVETLKDFMVEGDLTDIPILGCKYTWSNKRRGNNLIMSRIDIIMVGRAIIKKMSIEIWGPNRMASDHRIIRFQVG
eukprot:TRINITY_DN24652_c0_g2_i2.p1 TRINITY_DN24652_c0_g2~~TRINITY_DN24652_c0_g2_i2.p1  ORF type:complete len:120 (-),score=13.49 TRINITY_DN24652_c0_g2_i2:132-491(-)